MKFAKQIVLSIVVMSVVSVLMLIGVGVLSYIYKWQADKALVGITVTYIVAGIAGGKVIRRLSEEINMGKKLMEGIALGTLFMVLLVIGSLLATENPFGISGRFLMIWMLLAGSACLGRIL